MSAHGDQLKFALGISALVSFYGIVSLVIWFLGPEFGYGYTYTIVVIALVLLTWPLALLLNHYRKKRAAKKEAAAAAAAAPGTDEAAAAKPAKGKGSAAPSRVYDELTSGAEEAVQWLKSSRLGGKKNEALYALPWFMVAG